MNVSVTRFADGAAIGTGACAVADNDVAADATLAATTLTLPAGRFLITAVVGSTPLTGAGRATTRTLDTTLSQAGTAQLPAVTPYHLLKDVIGATRSTVRVTISVQRMVSSTWTHYAGGSASQLLAAPTANRSGQLRGGNVHAFGVNQGRARTQPLLDAAVDLGMKVIRTGVPWGYIEQAGHGTYDTNALALLDGFMADLASRSLKAVLIVGGAPGWSAAAPTAGKSNYAWSGANYSFVNGGYGPDTWTNFQSFVTFLVNRYGPELYALEPLNEPNNSQFNSSPAANVVNWHKYLKLGVQASNRPGVVCVGGVTSWNDATYIESLYAAGVGQWVDAISVHPYPFSFETDNTAYDPRWPHPDVSFKNSLAGVSLVRAVMDAHGDTSKPIWVTEFGQSAALHAWGATKEQQAASLDFMFRLLARVPYVDVAVMHALEDSGSDGVIPTPTNWANVFGLLRTDHASKRQPAYDQVKTTLAALPA